MSSEPATNRPVWQIEQTNPDVAALLKAGLSEVTDPEIGLNIIQLGLVRDVYFEDGILNIKMILTTPFCPYGPTMLEMTHSKAEEAAQQNVHIELGMETWDFSMMEEGTGFDWGLY